MLSGFQVEKETRKKIDPVLFYIILLLLGVGLTFLFSSSYPNAIRLGKNPDYFLKRQLVMVGAGLIGALFFAGIPVEKLKKSVPYFLIISFILSVAVITAGKEIQGAKRWIIFAGHSFQPSELVKISVILYIASVFSKKHDKIGELYTVSHPAVVVAVFALIIFAQNDFSTAMFLIFVSGAMFFIAGVKIRYFFSSVIAAVPFLLILILSKEHRVKRLIAFIDPEKDPVGVGYQIIKAKAALVSGGLWGSGIGNGVKKFGTLPEAHSDFIFAVVGEETGFIGIFIIIILFAVFAFRGYAVSREREVNGDHFSSFLGFGITTSILYQALMNMAVVSGVVPATGIPLPFFSHGGSSMLVTLIMCGMLLNISKNYQNEKENYNE